MGDAPIVVATGGGTDDPAPSTEAAHELGAHDEKLKQHEERLDEHKSLIESLGMRVDNIAERTADVPEEVWTRLSTLENKAQEALDKATEAVLEPVNETLPAEPLPVTPHLPTEPSPSKKSNGNPILSLVRRLR